MLAGVPDRLRNLIHLVVVIAQKLNRPADAYPRDIVHKSDARALAEHPAQVLRGDMRIVRRLCEGEFLPGKVFFDVFFCIRIGYTSSII